MKAKSIRKILRAKCDQFIASIKDEALRERVAKNIIITGGCIPSMLLKEAVNDYDIYFRTKDVAADVARYYINAFKTDFGEGIGWTLDIQDDRVKIIIQSAGVIGPVADTEGGEDEFMPTKLNPTVAYASLNSK